MISPRNFLALPRMSILDPAGFSARRPLCVEALQHRIRVFLTHEAGERAIEHARDCKIGVVVSRADRADVESDSVGRPSKTSPS